MAQKAEMNLINPSTGLYEPYHLQTEPDMILGWARKESTAYAVGAVVRLSALDVNKKLVCVKAGTSAAGNLTVSSTAEGALITDGTCVWQVDSFADGNYDAAHQNGIYRGADITAYWQSGHMSANIRAGVFVGMHIGDYIVKTVNLPAITYTDKAGASQTQEAMAFVDVKWLVGGINSHYHSGEGGSTRTPHVLLIAERALQVNVKMNPNSTTDGGYVGSDMWRVHMPNWTTAIKNAFGSDHVLRYSDYLSNSVNTTVPSRDGSGVGASGSAVWVDVDVNIPNEHMIYSGAFGNQYDYGSFPSKLPIFDKKSNAAMGSRLWYWLSTVVSTQEFALHYSDGREVSLPAASAAPQGGILPFFLLY